jgi:hypothetical protein
MAGNRKTRRRAWPARSNRALKTVTGDAKPFPALHRPFVPAVFQVLAQLRTIALTRKRRKRTKAF